MRVPPPKLNHPPETLAAIVQEHRAEPLRLAQSLQSLGWAMADAAWAAAHWPPEWLAAAIADEKQARGMKLHTLLDEALAKQRAELTPKLPDPPRARRTPRIKPSDQPKEK